MKQLSECRSKNMGYQTPYLPLPALWMCSEALCVSLLLVLKQLCFCPEVLMACWAVIFLTHAEDSFYFFTSPHRVFHLRSFFYCFLILFLWTFFPRMWVCRNWRLYIFCDYNKYYLIMHVDVVGSHSLTLAPPSIFMRQYPRPIRWGSGWECRHKNGYQLRDLHESAPVIPNRARSAPSMHVVMDKNALCVRRDEKKKWLWYGI